MELRSGSVYVVGWKYNGKSKQYLPHTDGPYGCAQGAARFAAAVRGGKFPVVASVAVQGDGTLAMQSTYGGWDLLRRNEEVWVNLEAEATAAVKKAIECSPDNTVEQAALEANHAEPETARGRGRKRGEHAAAQQ